jgi:hypothetical protein
MARNDRPRVDHPRLHADDYYANDEHCADDGCERTHVYVLTSGEYDALVERGTDRPADPAAYIPERIPPDAYADNWARAPRNRVD